MTHTETSQPPQRASVRKFFRFRVNNDALLPRRRNYKGAAWSAGISLIGAYSQELGAVFACVVALLFTGAFLGIDHWLIHRQLEKRRKAKQENHTELWKLSRETRELQASDVMKALLRIFDRTMLERSALATFDQRYVFDDERALFNEETLESKLGDLQQKSIRLLSIGNTGNQAVRQVRWGNQGVELFFNPTRLVTLFLTDSQLIICDVQIDSMEGTLAREEIQRIAISKMVSIHFIEESTRNVLGVEEAERCAEDLGCSKEELEEIRRQQTGDDSSGPRWVRESIDARLKITRQDHEQLLVPVRSTVFFGRHTGTLDRASWRSKDEIQVDRMVNELNRRVEMHARARSA